MARPRQVSDADILAAARQCFLQHGPGVSTTVIARQIGLSQAALFKRFGTKDDLMYAALLPPEVPDWVRHVEQGPDERPVPVQLLDIAERMHAFFSELTPCLMVLRTSGSDMREAMASRFDVPPPLRARMALIGWFQQVIHSGRVRPASAATLATMFIGGLHGQAFLSYIGGQAEDADAYLRDMVDTLWRGLQPEETA